MNTSPVFIVDDDSDDRFLIKEVWRELEVTNPLLFFEHAENVIAHLKDDPTPPFLIICDVNLPGIDGFELRKRLQDNSNFRYKTIPFIFWSTKALPEQVKRSYDLGGHGFFIKDSKFEDLKESFKDIISYWLKSKTPEKL